MSKGESPDDSTLFKILTNPILSGGLGSTFFGGSWKYKGFESNIESYKKNVDAFIETMEELKVKEDEFFKGTTYEAFEGVSFVDADELRTEYEELFSDLGLNTNTYSSLIDDMVDQNQVLITSMQDVRSSFVETFSTSGSDIGTSFIDSMTTVFTKLGNNITQVLYDTLFSDATNSGEKFFNDFTEGLVEAKRGNKTIEEVISDSFEGNKGFMDELIKISEMEGSMDEYWDMMRESMKSSGISNEIIDQLIPKTEIATEFASSITEAMTAAIDDYSFNSFSETLGDSIYDSVKTSLIEAFAESYLSEALMKEWMGDVDFTGMTPGDAFNVINDMLGELENELIAEGLKPNQTSIDSTEEAISSNIQAEADTVTQYYITNTLVLSGTNVFDSNSEDKLFERFIKYAKEKEKDYI
jgi:hypothetical protein